MGGRALHLIYLIQEAIDEIVGLPRLPRLLVQLDLLRDENPKRSFGIFSGVAWEPVQEGGENVHLGGQEINRTLNKTINSLWGGLDQDFDVVSCETLQFQHSKTAPF